MQLRLENASIQINLPVGLLYQLLKVYTTITVLMMHDLYMK